MRGTLFGAVVLLFSVAMAGPATAADPRIVVTGADLVAVGTGRGTSATVDSPVPVSVLSFRTGSELLIRVSICPQLLGECSAYETSEGTIEFGELPEVLVVADLEGLGHVDLRFPAHSAPMSKDGCSDPQAHVAYQVQGLDVRMTPMIGVIGPWNVPSSACANWASGAVLEWGSF